MDVYVGTAKDYWTYKFILPVKSSRSTSIISSKDYNRVIIQSFSFKSFSYVANGLVQRGHHRRVRSSFVRWKMGEFLKQESRWKTQSPFVSIMDMRSKLNYGFESWLWSIAAPLPPLSRERMYPVPGIQIVGCEGQAAREGKILRVLTEWGTGQERESPLLPSLHSFSPLVRALIFSCSTAPHVQS